MNVRRIQERLTSLGFDPGRIDGRNGAKTKAAVKAFQESVGLRPDGIVGQRTLKALFPPAHQPQVPESKFDRTSAARLAKAHPQIQRVMNAAREEIAFTILESQRGRREQEVAYKAGASKAHYGQSAHNWTPAIAVDIAPVPLDWMDRQAFIELSKVILPTATAFAVPLRWGGDWNMDGNPADGWDMPHYELHPWRSFARDCEPYRP